MRQKTKKPINPSQIRWLVWSIYIIMVITIVLAWVFYPQPYDFWGQTTSQLGALYTAVNELRNFPSFVIFSIGFVLLGIIAIFTGSLYFNNTKQFRFAIIKGVLLVVMGLGAIGIAVPHDYTPLTIIHQIGAFMFLSGLATLNAVFQVLHCVSKYGYGCEERNLDYYVDYIFVVLLILAAVMYYATEVIFYLWPAGWWMKPPMMQKILLFTAIIAAGLLDLDDIK
jgi:hypothetical protein